MPKYLDMHGLDTLTSDIEATYLRKNKRGVAGGVASLDSNGKVPMSQMPSGVQPAVTAESTDVGKIIAPKTVSNGKVTEWQYVDLSTLFVYVYYTYNLPEIAAHSTNTITGNNFGIANPSGYKPFALGRFTTGSVMFTSAYVNPFVTGTSNVMAFVNTSDTAQSSKIAGVGIVYIRSEYRWN